MRKYGRKDANQDDIVEKLLGIGASVQSLASVGDGVPDILVGYLGVNYLFEIKDGDKPPSKRRLTPDEIDWHTNWKGNVLVVKSFEEALDFLQRGG